MAIQREYEQGAPQIYTVVTRITFLVC